MYIKQYICNFVSLVHVCPVIYILCYNLVFTHLAVQTGVYVKR